MVRIEGGTRGRERLWQHWRQDSWGRVVLLLGAPGTSIGREGMCDRFQARKEQQRTPDRHEAAARRDRRRSRLKNPPQLPVSLHVDRLGALDELPPALWRGLCDCRLRGGRLGGGRLRCVHLTGELGICELRRLETLYGLHHL